MNDDDQGYDDGVEAAKREAAEDLAIAARARLTNEARDDGFFVTVRAVDPDQARQRAIGALTRRWGVGRNITITEVEEHHDD